MFASLLRDVPRDVPPPASWIFGSLVIISIAFYILWYVTLQIIFIIICSLIISGDSYIAIQLNPKVMFDGLFCDWICPGLGFKLDVSRFSNYLIRNT